MWLAVSSDTIPLPLGCSWGWVFGEKYPILLSIKIYILSIYFATKHVCV